MLNRSLLYDRKNIDLWNGKPSGIFDNMGTASPDVPEMKTWTALQERELKMLTLHPPANIFQEMILWTDQGKLWKFPIDNEQGLHITFYNFYKLFFN